MKRKKIGRYFKLLNPKNLAKEVQVYGYKFSWKSHVLVLFCSLLGIGAIGVLFKLEPAYFSIVLLVMCAMLPVVILHTYKRMFEQKRFADAVTYAEQILESLDIIEEGYACTKIHMVHELLVSIEEYGGDAGNSVLLVLNDIELWKRRGYTLQADKMKSHTDNMISIVVAMVICAIALYVLDSMGTMFPGVEGTDIFKVGAIQLSSFVFILCMLYVLVKSFKSLTSNWLQSDSLHEEAYILSSYETVVKYDEAKEKRKSIIFSVPFFLGAVPAFYFGKIWLTVLLMLIAAFMLMQHRVGYSLAKKDVNNELYVALPQWLMEIALLLQNNNVQVSIGKSMQEAPVILRMELVLLMERLQEAPESLQAYIEFCKKFDVPEIQSSMKWCICSGCWEAWEVFRF